MRRALFSCVCLWWFTIITYQVAMFNTIMCGHAAVTILEPVAIYMKVKHTLTNTVKREYL